MLLSLAAVAAAVVTLFGEDGAFRLSTVIGALAGLVPWALVAGGVRLHPWLFAALSVPPAVVVVAVANNPGGMFPLMVTVVWLALTSRSVLPTAVTALAGFLAILDCTLEKGSLDESGIVYFTGGLGISWLSGMLLRRQEALTAQVEAMRDRQVEQLAASERARISREVHDVVAHSLTVVMLNLTGARRALATDPERADEALARAEAVGRDSLDAIREVMDLLRDPDGATALPEPTLAGMRRLVDGYRRAGLDVVLDLRRTANADPTVELVAYRVVAAVAGERAAARAGRAARVALTEGAGTLDVSIANGPAIGGAAVTDGPGRARDAGHGRTGSGDRRQLRGRTDRRRRVAGRGTAPGPA